MTRDSDPGTGPARVRDLPHSVESEQAVLGAILSEEAAFKQVALLLGPSDFYLAAHQHIFAACEELGRESIPPDPILVQQRLDANRLLGSSVPRELPLMLQQAVGTAGNLEHYARVLRDLARRRRFMLEAQRAVELGYEGGSSFETEALARITEAVGSRKWGRVEPVQLTMDDIRNPPIEEFVLGSFFPMAKATVFFGPTGVGKSAALAQIAFAFAAGCESLWGLPLLPGGGPVLVYTTEDTLDDWKRKAATLLNVGGINVARALERLFVIDKTEGIARLSEVLSVRTGGQERSVLRRVGQPTPERDEIIHAVRTHGARVVLVETASRLVDREENEDFSALQSALGHIARETGAAVIVSHHPTKAAAKSNDSSPEAARGGGALIGNARCALALFPADMSAEPAKGFRGRFPDEDFVVLDHIKATSSTKRQPPVVLVRTDGKWGAVFRRPDEVAMTPDQEARNAERLEVQRQAELEAFRQLYTVVEKYLPSRPKMSPSWLRDQHHAEIGVRKNGAYGVEALVQKALDAGILRVASRNDVGIALALGRDPRKPICAPVAEVISA